MIRLLEYNPSLQSKLDTFFFNVFRANGFTYEPCSKHKDLRNIQKVFIHYGGGFWMLMKDEVVLGSAALKILNPKTGELKCLYVLPQYQGKGYGQELLNKVISESEIRKLHSIRLDVKTDSTSAIALYKKNGFMEIPPYNDNKNTVLFMERLISGV